MVNPEKTFTSKLGHTRAGPRTRIWLEGNRLIAHGFTHGACVARDWREDRLILSVVDQATFDALPREERTTVAGSAARPIIDIATTRVSDTFKGERVQVTYRMHRITVTEG